MGGALSQDLTKPTFYIAVQNETSNAPAAAASITEQNEVYCLPTVHSAGKNSSNTAAAAVPLQSRGDRATTQGGNTATAEEYDYILKLDCSVLL